MRLPDCEHFVFVPAASAPVRVFRVLLNAATLIEVTFFRTVHWFRLCGCFGCGDVLVSVKIPTELSHCGGPTVNHLLLSTTASGPSLLFLAPLMAAILIEVTFYSSVLCFRLCGCFWHGDVLVSVKVPTDLSHCGCPTVSKLYWLLRLQFRYLCFGCY